jgi:hypothetical protein
LRLYFYALLRHLTRTEFPTEQEQDFFNFFCFSFSVRSRAPKILLEGEILLEEQDFKPEFVDQNQEFREILFLLDGNLCA